MTVIKPGRTYELLATNTLETGCMASPAVSGKTLFLRTKTHLYRIESNGPIPKREKNSETAPAVDRRSVKSSLS